MKEPKLTKLIDPEIPEQVLKALATRGHEFSALVERYRGSNEGKQRQATANYLAMNFDDVLWRLYWKTKYGTIIPKCLWIRLADYEAEKGISQGTARRAAEKGLVPGARKKEDGTWVVPSDCCWQPREYNKS